MSHAVTLDVPVIPAASQRDPAIVYEALRIGLQAAGVLGAPVPDCCAQCAHVRVLLYPVSVLEHGCTLLAALDAVGLPRAAARQQCGVRRIREAVSMWFPELAPWHARQEGFNYVCRV